MYTSMACQCGAHFEVDTDDYEDSVLLMMHRFANSHEKHGFMSQPTSPDRAVGSTAGQIDGNKAE